MNQTEKQTKKHRFNIVDFVLILTVIACVVGIAVRSNLKIAVSNEKDTVMLTVKVYALKNEYLDAFVIGDTFYYHNMANLPLGTLTAVESTPAVTRFVNSDGTWSTAYYDDRIDVTCKIEATGVYSEENGFMLDGSTYIGSGSGMAVRSSRIETSFYVLNVEPIEN